MRSPSSFVARAAHIGSGETTARNISSSRLLPLYADMRALSSAASSREENRKFARFSVSIAFAR